MPGYSSTCANRTAKTTAPRTNRSESADCTLSCRVADDIHYRASLLAADRFGTDPYLAVTTATRYNEFVVPDMGLAVTVDDASGETVLSESLSAGLDPELGFHYGIGAPGVTDADSVTVEVTTPPQVARHEGYETAFFKTPTLTLS